MKETIQRFISLGSAIYSSTAYIWFLMFHMKHRKENIMTLRDVLLACGNLKNSSPLIIIEMNNKSIYQDTVSGCFEKNLAYMKMEVDYFKIFFHKNSDKIICLI